MKVTTSLAAATAVVAGLLLAGCSKPSPDQSADASATAATAEPAAADAADPAATDGDYAGPTREDAVKFAAAMAAAVEVCGMSTPAESEKGLQGLKEAAAREGGSPDQVERIYRAALDQAKAQAKADPAKLEKDCESLRKMTDPAEIKKMEEATKKLEKMAAEMEAKAAQ